MEGIPRTKGQKDIWLSYMFFGGTDRSDRRNALSENFNNTDIHSMAKSVEKTCKKYGDEGQNINKQFLKYLNHIQDEKSPGGKTVTPEEQKELYEYMLHATGYYREYPSKLKQK